MRTESILRPRIMRLRVLAVLLILPAVCAVPSRAATPESPELQDELSKQTDIYRSRGEDVPEGYVIGRSLLSYTFALGEDFKSALAKLGPNDRWLDIGAGEGR